MNCSCGKKIDEGMAFCPQCGTNIKSLADIINAEAVIKEEPDAVKSPDNISKGDKPHKKKKKKKLLIFLYSFALFLGILIGMWGGYYVAKNGWNKVPFSDKLTFLPFIKSEEETVEIVSYTGEENDDEDIKSKEDIESTEDID
jgi:uncharacterized membrane protein YvbJ